MENWDDEPKREPFFLFARRDPVTEARKYGLIDPMQYQRWSKAERKIYSMIKAQQIQDMVRQQKFRSDMELCEAVSQLKIISSEGDDEVLNMVRNLEKLRI